MTTPRTNAGRDQNHVTTLLGVSSVDGTTPVPLEANPATGALLIEGGGSGGGGDVNIAKILGNPVSPTNALPVSIENADITVNIENEIEIKNDTGNPVPMVDANKENALASALVLTSSTTLAPSSGKRLKIVKAQILQNPDNTSSNLVTLNFTSLGDFFKVWVGSDSSEWIGAVNEVLNITLANANPVSVNIRYKEV